jgi:hypothetical protein
MFLHLFYEPGVGQLEVRPYLSLELGLVAAQIPLLVKDLLQPRAQLTDLTLQLDLGCDRLCEGARQLLSLREDTGDQETCLQLPTRQEQVCRLLNRSFLEQEPECEARTRARDEQEKSLQLLTLTNQAGTGVQDIR